MSEHWRKSVVIAETALLLVPLTLFAILVAFVAYAAYPPPDLQPIQVGFDLSALLVAAATVATWRLVIGYLFAGARAMRLAHAIWFVLSVTGGLIGVAGAVIAAWHALDPDHAPDYVGFALLAPAAVLVVIAAHLLWERYRAR